MGSFGENLRREREMRGVTLEEISSATKISMRALEALERENFRQLPGGIFNRSFLRTYARYLGLDEEKVLAEYQAVCPKGEDVDLRRFAPAKTALPEENPRGRLIGLLLVLAMLAGGFALYRYSRRALASAVGLARSPSAAARNERVSTAAMPEGAASLAPANSDATEKAQGTAAAGGHPPAGDKLLLQVAATERTWVAVDADGKPAFQRILNAHEIQTVQAKNSFDFMTGNAQAVILTLNGETLKPLGGPGEVKKVHLTRDDLKAATP